jgi:hypothetical protein
MARKVKRRLQTRSWWSKNGRDGWWLVAHHVALLFVLGGLCLKPLLTWETSSSSSASSSSSSSAVAASSSSSSSSSSTTNSQPHSSKILSFWRTRKSSSSSKDDDISNNNNNKTITPPNTVLLLLDVDNTLYREEAILQSTGVAAGSGIESQIVRNIHNFCAKHPLLNLTSAQADDLHHQYGSTIEGIIQIQRQQEELQGDDVSSSSNNNHLQQQQTRRLLLQDFYHNVYDNIDVSALLLHTGGKSSSYSSTGYSSSTSISASLLQKWQKEHVLIQKILRSIMTSSSSSSSSSVSFPVQLASNSPKLHGTLRSSVYSYRIGIGVFRLATSLPYYNYDLIRTVLTVVFFLCFCS